MSHQPTAFEPTLTSEEAARLRNPPEDAPADGARGSVPAYRIGDLWRFRASDLDAWLRSGVSLKSPLVPLTCERKFSLFTRTRYQYGSLEPKERKKGKVSGSFAITKPMPRRTAAPGRHGRITGRTIRPNPPLGSHRWYKRSCCGSMQNSRRARCRQFWSRDRPIREGRNAGKIFNKRCLPVVHQNHIRPRWARPR